MGDLSTEYVTTLLEFWNGLDWLLAPLAVNQH